MTGRIPRQDVDDVVLAAQMAHRIRRRPSVLDFIRQDLAASPLRPRDAAVFLIGFLAVLLFVVLFLAAGPAPVPA